MSFILNPYRFSAGGASSLLTDVVAWWSLDETSGIRYDAHGAHDLTDTSGTTGYTTGKISNAAVLVPADATSLTVASHADFVPGSSSFHIVGWAQFSSSSDSNAAILGKISRKSIDTGDATLEYSLIRRTTNAQVKFQIKQAAGGIPVQAAQIAVTYDVPFFFECGYDSAAQQVFLSIDLGTRTTGSCVGVYEGTTPFNIGMGPDSSAGTTVIDGWVDEVAFRNGSLWSASELSELYNSGSGMAYPG